jgi:hypothetical protein
MQAADISTPLWPVVTQPASYDGLAHSPDGRWLAQAGCIVATTPPGGRRIQQLWTTREFPQNFVLKLEFRATPNADGASRTVSTLSARPAGAPGGGRPTQGSR